MITTIMSMLQHVCSLPPHVPHALVHSRTPPPLRFHHHHAVAKPHLLLLLTCPSHGPSRPTRLVRSRPPTNRRLIRSVPQAFRNDLIEAGWRIGRSPIYHTVTAADGTVKLLIKLEDNRLIETVGIPVEDEKGSMRLTACVSSQVGYPLRCSFCATGRGGFSRNLQRHEIIEQDVQIGQRMTTISTVGVPNTIKKLASHKLQSTLAVILHSPNQKLMEMIVPSAKSYPLDAIMKDCRDYFAETSRRVSFEYALLAGVNDSVEQAVELAELLHEWGRGYHVNLIPFNPIEGLEYRRPYKKAVVAFAGALESRKITVSIR
ncbi:hypothetical protein REPUB_Repub13aG0079400 [Reevesia pubescens]